MGDFGVYIHWPFCASKCPYCDFNSHVRPGGVDETRFLQAYLRELEYFAELSPGKRVKSIFFGGGTPSLMQPHTVQSLIAHIEHLWGIEEDAEITLEANPSSVEADRFAGYQRAGVNRVSLGIQAFHDTDLHRLGRLHSVDEAEQALSIAHNTFERVSFDLIYARPEQSPESWYNELNYALQKAPSHMSLYQLTIEPGTRFADLYSSGKLCIPGSELAEEHYLITQELCEAAHMPAYEISNHAKAGQDCQHNLIYWRYGSYVGTGPGAHGRLDVAGNYYATSTEPHPEKWKTHVAENHHGMILYEALSLQEQADEMLLMGLRLTDGIDLDQVVQRTGFAPKKAKLERLQDDGLIIFEDNVLSVTKKGRFVLNYVINDIATSLEKIL